MRVEASVEESDHPSTQDIDHRMEKLKGRLQCVPGPRVYGRQ